MPAPLKDSFIIKASDQSLQVQLVTSPTGSFAVGRTGQKGNPEALQGFHSENLLFILDEASGIDDEVFHVAQGALSTPGAKVLMTANPTRTSGYFYDSHHKMRNRWHTIKVSCVDSPRVSQQYIDDMAAQFGLDSSIYNVRVLGEFPNTEDDVLIPLYLLEAALERDVEPSESFRPVWGLDVARYGDDRTALAKRQANVLMEPVKAWHGNDLMQTVGRIVQEYRLTDSFERPSAILVDSIGIGSGVVDRLKELGLPVRGINVAETPTGDEFARLRDELWWKTREWFEDRSCKLCDDLELISELSEVKYEVNSSGKLKIESKDDMKKRGRKSPDLADAFILTFAGGLELKDDEPKLNRYKTQLKRRRKSTWLTV
jgi:hypothetical protein